MLTKYTIKDLYALALAEGEGMGTAYEYYAKRRVLEPWLKGRAKPKSILIAGLPERYGLSLDFLLLATELGAAVTVIDERPESLERLRNTRDLLLQQGIFRLVEPQTIPVNSPADFGEQVGDFDLSLTSEVLQRLTTDARSLYIQAVRGHSLAAALFAPNADNAAHTNRSGLAGLYLTDLQQLVSGPTPSTTGYIDMPPFPPGITRSDEQREQATTGAFENTVMWGLGHYARHENWVPGSVRRTQSHIVFALTPGKG